MDDLHFMSLDDLVEQERDEVRRVLFGKAAGQPSPVEFLLTLEFRSFRRQNQVQSGTSSNQYVSALPNASAPQMVANYGANVQNLQPRFQNPAPNFAVPPPSLHSHPFVQDALARNGVSLQQTAVHSSQQTVLQPPMPFAWYQGRVIFAPYYVPQGAAFAVPTSNGQNFPSPYMAVPGPGSFPFLMVSPPFNNNPQSSGQANYDEATNQTADIQNSLSVVQLPVDQPQRADDLHQSSFSTATEADVSKETAGEAQTESALPSPEDVIVSATDIVDNFPNSSAIDTSVDAQGQKPDQNDPEDGRNTEDDASIRIAGSSELTNGSAPPEMEDSPTDAQHADVETKVASELKSEIPPAVVEGPKTFASLFRNTRAANEAIVTTVLDEQFYAAVDDETALQIALQESVELGGDKSRLNSEEIWVPAERDPHARNLANTVKKYVLQDRGPTYSVRGITNQGNSCYANATFQALMACPTFFHLLRHLSTQLRRHLPSSTPLLDACTRLASEFTLVKDLPWAEKNAKLPSLDLSHMHSIVSRLKTDSSFKGRQEDAEEFLLFVLNRLHEELVAVLALLDTDKTGQRPRTMSGNNGVDANSSEWHQVGAGKKITVTRQIKVAQSPILDIFAGQLRYGLSRPGAKESASLEPFFTLPLDVLVHSVKNIETALQVFTSKEVVKNVQGNNQKEVDGTRRVTLFELPRVLILQLKYFEYTAEGLKKNVKKIDFSMDLTIGLEYVANPKLPVHDRRYKLFAVVFHHGEKAEGGHYTVDVFHAGQWINLDDTKTTEIKQEQVLSFQPPRVPYLLFYRHLEPINSDQHQRRSEGGNYQKR